MNERVLEGALLGVPVFSADVATADEVHDVIASLRTHPGSLLVLRMRATAIRAAQAAERAGGHLCDILITLSRTVDAGGLPAPAARDDGLHIRQGVPEDAPALRTLAQDAFSEFVGHWHTDARVPSPLADELYARWAADLAKHSARRTPLWVAERAPDNALVGFLALREVADAHWDVPLTAVSSSARGQQLLDRMLAHATASICATTPARLDYETQLANAAALRVVGRLGFVPATSRLTFHYWADTTSP